MGRRVLLLDTPLLAFLLTLCRWVRLLFGWRSQPPGLHTARFATRQELSPLLTPTPPPEGVLLGTTHQRRTVSVQPTPARPEHGNLLLVGPTRSGKGLLAISQLLSWQHSVVVNDLKGELFAATAGYRATLGPVFVVDPTGVGHHYDPLATRYTDDILLAAGTAILHKTDRE